ncbi:MAG: hypothetical protein IK152_03080 [Lachnospiraceae bacterium]|nr:hypothetical protein [Lachnospiraceae bacterium]
MKTSHVPVLCMLVAGITTFVLDIVQGMNFSTLLRDFLISLVCFFIIGQIAKVFLDKAFNPKPEETEEGEKEDFPVGEEGENPPGEEGAEGMTEGGEASANEGDADSQEDTEAF